MPSIHDGRNIDIDNVPVDQLSIARNAVTDHIVNAGAATLGEMLVIQRCGAMPVTNRVFIDHLVNFPGRNAWFDVITHVIQQLGVEPAGDAHGFGRWCRSWRFPGIKRWAISQYLS